MRGVGELLAIPGRRSTWHGFVYLAIGIALIAPYGTLGTLVAEALEGPWAETAAWGSAAVLSFLVLPALTGLLSAVRELEIFAVRRLLGVELAEVQAPDSPPSWPTRWRSATWFTLHVLAGGLIATLILTLPPAVVSARGGWTAPLAILAPPVLIYFAAAMCAALGRIAPALLGPSPAERLAAVQRQAARLAERNRLARELHDSVGHALGIVTVQAGAAGRVLDSDLDFARKALTEIENSARHGLRDLDHVVGLLRDDASSRAPAPTLGNLQRLVESTRSAGVDIRAQLSGSIDDVPQAISREAYRIVQESLNNAARHAGSVPVSLRLHVGTDDLELELSNPLDKLGAQRPGGGRGLTGIRERVSSLRGQVFAGPDGHHWRVSVRLPLHPRP